MPAPSLRPALLPVLAALFFSAGCGEKVHLTLGLITPRNPALASKAYEPLAKYLAARTGTTMTLDAVVNYADGVARMQQHTWDLAFVTGQTYLEAKPAGYQVLAMVTEKGQGTYHAVLVSRADGPIKRLADLKGKRLAFVSKKSASGYLFPMKLLLDAGLDPARDLALSFTGNAGIIGHAVANPGAGQGVSFDAGAIYEGFLADNPDLAKKLRVLATSDPIPHGPVVAGPRVLGDATLSAALSAALLEAHDKAPEAFTGPDIFFDGFAAPNAGIYDRVAEVEARVRAYEKDHPIKETGP